MEGLIAGLFFDEDCLPYLAPWQNDRRFDYWRNATFSPRVLELWQDHCRTRGVTVERPSVDKFPVHSPAMANNGAGRTAFYPGWNMPESVRPGQKFVDLQRPDGVWRHWYDFTCELSLDNWIARLAALANDANRSVKSWKGVMYFGLHQWSLPYEEIRPVAETTNRAFLLVEVSANIVHGWPLLSAV
jgi:hypothetical protein